MVILINPYYPSSPFNVKLPFPVGLGYLSESLLSHHIDNIVVNLEFETEDELIQRILINDVKYVCFSLISLDIQYHYQTILRLKRRLPLLTIITGGPHISFEKHQVLLDCPAIDYGITYEGEFTLPELLNFKERQISDGGGGGGVYRGVYNRVWQKGFFTLVFRVFYNK
jgi:hypothetical protein